MPRLIDADALHNVLRKKPKWVVRNGDKHNEGYTYDQVHFAIDDMPTIDAEPVRHGRWVKKGQWYYCTECGTEMFFTGVYDPNQHYCYYCGVKMDGGDPG